MAHNLKAGRHSDSTINSAVVVVQKGETTEQAWRRHLKKHPEDSYAQVRIFHFNLPNPFQNLLIV